MDNNSSDSPNKPSTNDTVTEEMIDAGVECLWDLPMDVLPELLGPSEQQLREILKRVFIRMDEVKKERHF